VETRRANEKQVWEELWIDDVEASPSVDDVAVVV
jgi:isopentenyldiphosphate isomerase